MTPTRKTLLCTLTLVVAACAAANAGGGATAPRGITSGNALVAAMHDRYANTWYKTLRFRQTVTRTRAGKESPPQVWLEHAMIPGYLRIDFAHDYNGTGAIYGPDTLYSFGNGKLTRKSAERNVLMVLGFDVYRQPLARSVQVLQEMGYDLSKIHSDMWEGKPVYVVGADSGDVHHKQFWIEKDRLLFVRGFDPSGAGGTSTTEYRFDNYQPLGKAWLAVKCVFLRDGAEFDREEYFDIEANPVLPAGLMDAAQWGTVNPK